MYKIIGEDQRSYGPVSADQIRQWIVEGRVTERTSAQAADSNDWKPLTQFPEFADALRNKPAAPPRMPATAARPALAPAPVRTSGMAIASLVLGIFGFCGVTALIGLILGIIAQNRITKSAGQLGGRGLAITGICLSAVMLFLSIPVMAGLLLPALAKAKARATSVNCVSHAKQLALGAKIYASEHDNKLPEADSWSDAISAYTPSKDIFTCPARPGLNSGFAFNSSLSGKPVDSVNPQTVLFFESDAGWNGAGGDSALISFPRHQFVTVAFADGSVRQVLASRLNELRWQP